MTPKARAPMTATPPTAPPTMAPTLDFLSPSGLVLLLAGGLCDDVDDGAEEDDSPRVVVGDVGMMLDPSPVSKSGVQVRPSVSPAKVVKSIPGFVAWTVSQ